MNDTRKELVKKFADKEFRHAYLDEFLNVLIATQIRVLRQARDLKQGDLAELAGMKQSRISELEDVGHEYVTTLKRIAKALDVALVVKFESFEKLLSEIEDYTPKHLNRSSFDASRFGSITDSTAMPAAKPGKAVASVSFIGVLDTHIALNDTWTRCNFLVAEDESSAVDILDLVVANEKKGEQPWPAERPGRRQNRK